MKDLIILAVLIFSLLIASCHKHDDIEITIDILSPVANQVVSNPALTLFNVTFTGTGSLHDIEIRVFPENNPSDLIINYDSHEHQATFEFMEVRDLSGYPGGTSFVMEIEAYKDEAAKHKEEKSISFRIP
jgi:hypothetical protein